MNSRSKIFSAILLLTIVLGGSVFSSAVTADVVAPEVEQQIQFNAPVMLVNTSFLNIRTGPGVRYSVLITVVGGTELPVLGKANDGVWYQVSTVVGVGWVNSEFVIPRGNFANVPTVEAPAFSAFGSTVVTNTPAIITLPLGQGGGGAAAVPQTAPAAGQGGGGGGAFDAGLDANGNPIIISSANERFRALINVEAVDLRDAPDGSPLTTLYRNDDVDYPIVGNARDANGVEWLAITVPNAGTGWVEAPKIRIRLSAACRTVLSVTAGSIGLQGTDIVLTSGSEAFLINITQDGNFVQVELPGGEVGFLPFNAIVTRTGTTTDGLNLDCNQAAPPSLGQGGGGTGDAPIAPTPVRPTLAGSHIIVNTAFLNVRSGPGAQYVAVATVPGGTELNVLGIASDRVWFLVEGVFGRGWVNEEFAIFRGVIDNVPVIQLSAVTGVLATPQAIINGAVTLYAAPGTTFGAVGTLAGPLEVAVVARTPDFNWVQLNTTLGFGWVQTTQVSLRGDTSLIPIAS